LKPLFQSYFTNDLTLPNSSPGYAWVTANLTNLHHDEMQKNEQRTNRMKEKQSSYRTFPQCLAMKKQKCLAIGVFELFH